MTVSIRRLISLAGLATAMLAAGGCPRAGSRQPAAVPRTTSTAPPVKEGKPMEPGVTIQYYGQSCFLVTDSKGTRVAIDPFGEGLGYQVPSLAAEVCLITHEHFDHSNTAAVVGNPEIIRTEGQHTAKGIPTLGITAPHHEPGKNTERGDVVIYRWVMDGVALVHCGDLGAPLNVDQIAALAQVDILLVPVGGHYTIDAGQAVQVVDDLKPQIVIPMHYRTEASAQRMSVLAPIDTFLQTIPSAWVVARPQGNSLTIPKSELVRKDAPIRVIVLNYR